MPSNDFRLVVPGSLTARRSLRELHPPRPTSTAGVAGLRFERRVNRQLLKHVDGKRFAKLEHNPWFTYSDQFGSGACCPDFILWSPEETFVVVTEVKLTWVSSAALKLQDLYMPVVSTALGVPTMPLTIVRNLTAEAPEAWHTLSEALMSDSKLLQWFDNGTMIW